MKLFQIILIISCLIMSCLLQIKRKKIKKDTPAATTPAQTAPAPVTSAPAVAVSPVAPAGAAPGQVPASGAVITESSYFKFTAGVIEQINGNAKDIDECLPGDWKDPKGSQDDVKTMPSFDQIQDICLFIEKNLEVSLDVGCKFKENVKDFFKKKAGVRNFSRRRIFLNNDNNPIDNLSEKTKDIFEKFRELMSAPLTKKTDAFLTCIKSAKGVNPGVVNTINNFEKNKEKFTTTLSTFVDIFIECVCNWKNFKDSFIFYKNALTAKDNLEKWNKLGQFYGKLIHIMGFVTVTVK